LPRVAEFCNVKEKAGGTARSVNNAKEGKEETTAYFPASLRRRTGGLKQATGHREKKKRKNARPWLHSAVSSVCKREKKCNGPNGEKKKAPVLFATVGKKKKGEGSRPPEKKSQGKERGIKRFTMTYLNTMRCLRSEQKKKKGRGGCIMLTPGKKEKKGREFQCLHEMAVGKKESATFCRARRGKGGKKGGPTSWCCEGFGNGSRRKKKRKNKTHGYLPPPERRKRDENEVALPRRSKRGKGKASTKKKEGLFWLGKKEKKKG